MGEVIGFPSSKDQVVSSLKDLNCDYVMAVGIIDGEYFVLFPDDDPVKALWCIEQGKQALLNPD
jgi:hypothetical protein